jgi:hypothetical protein
MPPVCCGGLLNASTSFHARPIVSATNRSPVSIWDHLGTCASANYPQFECKDLPPAVMGPRFLPAVLRPGRVKRSGAPQIPHGRATRHAV